MEFVETDHKKDTMIGSTSAAERKMSIKFKFPKLPAAVKAENSPEKVIGSSKPAKMANQGIRVCPECKKEFKSGKAFGGHMRVHVQAAAAMGSSLRPVKTEFKKSELEDHNNGDEKDRSKTPRYMRCVNDEGKPTCSLCSKIFPSMKSLFGHMRCHPDRNWRGILPPPDAAVAAAGGRTRKASSGSFSSSLSENGVSSNEEGDEAVDLTKFLWRWPAKEKRGRKKLDTADDDEILQEAVEDLLTLAHGGPSMVDSGMIEREEIEGTNSNSLTNKEKIDDKSPSPDILDKGSSTMEDEIEEKSKLDFDDEGIKNFISSNRTKKIKKMKLMTELELGLSGEMIGTEPTPPLPLLIAPPPAAAAAAVTDGKYKCTTCNKCFASYQALGGHRSSHNKLKITSMDLDEGVEIVKKEIEFEAPAMAVATEGIHQCKACNKIYATGQALGGHKRCHWTRPTEEQTPVIQVVYAGEEGSQTAAMGGGRKVLDFDLNEVPPLMMEDEAGSGYGNGNGNGNGSYASSSYNSNMN